MKILGIDFGTKKMGIAIAHLASGMAFPLATIKRSTRNQTFADILDIIAREKCQEVVVGLPLGLGGEESLTTRQAQNFAQSLKRRVSIPVHLENEALTTFEANDKLKQAGTKAKKIKDIRDQLAAVEILNSYISRTQSDNRLLP